MFATVEELAEMGATVYTCSRNEEALNQRLHEWSSKGFNVSGKLDILLENQVVFVLLILPLLNLEIVLHLSVYLPEVNNVGTNIKKPTVDYTAEEYSSIMTTNFDSAYHLCQVAHPLLKASGKGSIVFISSVAGLVHIYSGSIYGATKGAMNQLTKDLACEWA
ncbi:hypothetical protein SASPL_145961 [Salvia splendens]|uniref:Tropinone reductase I n=1 Tax=Salvia splendens TaxID=180675 RepID=A0A8X8WHX8_SALSN|nr:hypothetical protein SASPL_145961 [Salvia splendens]